jgi:hypothetical protein
MKGKPLSILALGSIHDIRICAQEIVVQVLKNIFNSNCNAILMLDCYAKENKQVGDMKVLHKDICPESDMEHTEHSCAQYIKS